MIDFHDFTFNSKYKYKRFYSIGMVEIQTIRLLSFPKVASFLLKNHYPIHLYFIVILSWSQAGTIFSISWNNFTAFCSFSDPFCFLSQTFSPLTIITRFLVTPGECILMTACGYTCFIIFCTYCASLQPPHAWQYSISTSGFLVVGVMACTLAGICEQPPPIKLKNTILQITVTDQNTNQSKQSQLLKNIVEAFIEAVQALQQKLGSPSGNNLVQLNLLRKMNPTSERTRNQNLLRTKTKSFKINIKESENRMKSSSSLNNLAGKLYSERINSAYSPMKSAKRGSSISKNASTSAINPQLMSGIFNATMNGLSMRASHVPSFSEANTTLLKQKKDLEKTIAIFKELIVQEKRKLNNAEYNCKKNHNEIQNFMAMYNEAQTKSNKLNSNIEANRHQCNNFAAEIRTLKLKIAEKKEGIEHQRNTIENYERETRNLKHSLMQEQKMRTQTKAELAKDQRVMNSASIYYKQLQNEKAMLLLEINQSVNTYKL